MSRIGRARITVPGGVEVTIAGQNVAVKGPKGQLSLDVHPSMQISLDEGVMTVVRPDDTAPNRSLHGLTRTLVSNMVTGVTTGFEKKLEIVGVGYRASKKGSDLEILVGYSHPCVVEPPENIEFEVPVPLRSWSRASTSSASVRWPPRSAPCASPNPTRAKASATRAKWCGARSASGRKERREMNLRRQAAMDAGEARTQGVVVAALRARPRTMHRTVQCGLGGRNFDSRRGN